jgi:hypothetical protein
VVTIRSHLDDKAYDGDIVVIPFPKSRCSLGKSMPLTKSLRLLFFRTIAFI